MNTKYILLAAMFVNASAVLACEAPVPVSEQKNTDSKTMRLVRIIFGLSGILEQLSNVDINITDYINGDITSTDIVNATGPVRFVPAIVACYCGIVNVSRGLSDKKIDPKDTGVFTKVMGLLGLGLPTTGFGTFVNGSMILLDGMQ